jgi:hypothetical protein
LAQQPYVGPGLFPKPLPLFLVQYGSSNSSVIKSCVLVHTIPHLSIYAVTDICTYVIVLGDIINDAEYRSPRYNEGLLYNRFVHFN